MGLISRSNSSKGSKSRFVSDTGMSLQEWAVMFPAALIRVAPNRKRVRGKTRINGQERKKKKKKDPNTTDKHNLILWFNAAKQKFCYSSPEDSQRVIYRNPAQKARPLPISQAG